MSNDNCIFCKIAAGEMPSKKLYDDDEMMAFEDVNPQAPVHLLVVPKTHIPTLDDVAVDQAGLVGRMMVKAAELAREKGVAEDGYRQIINCRQHGGQEVFHLHIHILGGRQMGKLG